MQLGANCVHFRWACGLRFASRLHRIKNVWMQRTTQRRIKLLDLSVAGSLVKEILVSDVTLSVDMYWP